MSLVSSGICLLTLTGVALLFQMMLTLESFIVFNILPKFDYIFCFGNFFTVVCNISRGVFHLQQSNTNIQFYCDNSMSESSETEVCKLLRMCRSLYQLDPL